MPPLPVAPQILRVTLDHQLGDDMTLGSRTFWHYGGTRPTSAVLDTIATDIAALWNAHLAALASTNTILDKVTVQDLTDDLGGVGEVVVADAGTRAGAQLSAGTCAVLSYQIARHYRGGKPRSYFPYGVSSDLATAQSWTTAFQTAFNSDWGSFSAGVQAISESGTAIDQHVNLSYYKGFTSVQNPVTKRWRNVPTPRDITLIDDVLTHSLASRIGSQRRRNLA